jgi:hypothetical protein
MGTVGEKGIQGPGQAERAEQPFLGLESSRSTSCASEDDSSANFEAEMEVRKGTGKRKVRL